ncbi:hypothetical protein GCM10022281_12420 [Sphingomonas rosea]|uniref:Methyl-accepting chemotaxis protein n=1 Tax=Sphingomonas rosea TaxID=335605 RepID=A0ABP7U0E8_9SPHN
MMQSFRETMPIRSKLFTIVAVMTGLVCVPTLVALVRGDLLAAGVGAAAAVAAGIVGASFREAISGPYVATVARMEALAKGDLDTPIAFTDYTDCVGRMTKAMFVFRDTAREQMVAQAREQKAVVDLFGDALKALRGGDLTVRITADAPPAYAGLKDAYNEAVAGIADLILAVTQSASGIRVGSDEIAQASEDLARRTEGNAASLEETSAAVQQMNGRLRASAEASSETVGRADQAIATVSGGRALADEAVQAMGRVSDSAKGIDSVIEGLDKIAFQTRVLAMNAAVEAGRAGEAGRGFAVVADLVSALAMRAEEEAKRARDQLTVTQTDIVSAVGAVEKVDGALQDISSDVGAVHQLLGSIASDNQAQAQAIAEISAAVSSMDQSTQQNAAMVEETSAAARNLLNEVTALAQKAQQFRTGGPAPAVLAPAKAAAPAPKPAAVGRPSPGLPKRGKEGAYVSPVKALPPMSLDKLAAGGGDDDWHEF